MKIKTYLLCTERGRGQRRRRRRRRWRWRWCKTLHANWIVFQFVWKKRREN